MGEKVPSTNPDVSKSPCIKRKEKRQKKTSVLFAFTCSCHAGREKKFGFIISFVDLVLPRNEVGSCCWNFSVGVFRTWDSRRYCLVTAAAIVDWVVVVVVVIIQ